MMFKCHIIVLIFTVTLATGGHGKEISSTLPTLDDLLDSLLRLVLFFADRYDHVNLDGLFGLRAAEGEMERALEKADKGEIPPHVFTPAVKNKVQRIKDLISRISRRALPLIKKQDEKYYYRFLSTIEKPWRPHEFKPQHLKKMDEKYLPDTLPNENDFTEEKSDECMDSVSNRDGKKCDVDKCWDLMTRPGTMMYYTTHQILYFQSGIKNGCLMDFEKKAPEVNGLLNIFRGHCFNIIFQMDTMFHDGTVAPVLQDIFLEKGFVCGSAGFVDALNLDWLKEALNWQDRKLGCFKEQDVATDNVEEHLFKQMNEKKLEWRSRNLLVDAEMGNSCSSHKSGVAAGYLAVHIRIFLENEHVVKRDFSNSWPRRLFVVVSFGAFLACAFIQRRRLMRLTLLCYK